MEQSQDFKIGFICGMIDSDGDVRIRNRTINISNTDFKLIEKLAKYFKAIGITVNIKKHIYRNKNWSNIYRIYVPQRFISYNINSIKVKRLHSMQRSGNL